MNTAEYWERRERDRLKTEQMADAEVNKQIEIIINNHMNRIIETVESFYQKYADENGISNATAKKMIDTLDMERYEDLAEYYVKNRHDKSIAFTDEANKQMRIYNVTMQINREKLVLAQMSEHLKNMGAEVETEMKQYLDESVTREFERQAGILGSINVSRTQFEAIINSTHLKDGKLWSERLWKNISEVQKEIDKAITDSLIRGHHPDKSVKRLRELTGRSDFEARRLLITEVTRAQSEAELISLKDKNIAEFIFLAQIDERTTVKCRTEHKSVHKLKDAKIGINVPPLHQFCRSSIAPNITPEAIVAKGGGAFNIFNDDEQADDWDEETGTDDGALDELEDLLIQLEKRGIDKKQVTKKVNKVIPADTTVKLNSKIMNAFNDEQKINVQKDFDNADERVKRLLNELTQNTSLKVGRGTASHYNPIRNELLLGREQFGYGTRGQSDKEYSRTLHHELGHAVDRQFHRKLRLSTPGGYSNAFKDESDRTLGEIMTDEYNAFEKAKHKEYKAAGKAKSIRDTRMLLMKEIKGDNPEHYWADLSDMIEGATKGKVQMGWGHGKSYWQRPGALSSEIFAELFSMYVNAFEVIEFLRQYIPDTITTFEEMLSIMAGEEDE